MEYGEKGIGKELRSRKGRGGERVKGKGKERKEKDKNSLFHLFLFVFLPKNMLWRVSVCDRMGKWQVIHVFFYAKKTGILMRISFFFFTVSLYREWKIVLLCALCCFK